MKQKLITSIVTAIAILTPLLIVPTFIDTNYNILKLWTLLIGGLLLIILLLCQYKNLNFDKKDICLFTFLGLVCISTFLSSDISKSLFGEENRYEGLLMFITYTCIYLASKKYFNFEKIETFFEILFIVSMIIGILGILQNYITTDQLLPLFGKGICSTFGNSNFFGSFISLILPTTIFLFILKGSKKSFLLSLVMFFNMLSSGTRSAWIAFGIIAILNICYLLKQKNKTYFKRLTILLLCFILIFVYLLIHPDSVMQNKFIQLTNDIENSIHKGINDEMGSGRIEIWKMTLKLIWQKPLLGCGTDNLKSGLRTNCSEDFSQFIANTWSIPDKAHNEYLHIAATIGIPALIAYLIFISIVLSKKVKYLFNEPICFMASIIIISYLIQAFFNISTIGVAPLFWMILGFLDNPDFINNLNKYIKISI